MHTNRSESKAVTGRPAGFIAVTGHFATAPWFLFLAVATWMFGFDVIYALMDVDFDTRHGVKSVPARSLG